MRLGALSPLKIQERCSSDPAFRERLFTWLKSIFHHDLPPGTDVGPEGVDGKKDCLLGRPPHPDDPDFDDMWPQFLRNVLDESGHVHRHSETCFKNMNVSMGKLDATQRDELCRFRYPQPMVPDTFIDDDGKIHHQRGDPNVVGYNPLLSGSFQCNTDGKFVGSGALGMALSIYMTNYTAKSSMDSAIVVSALAAALKALQATADGLSCTMDEERCRRLLLKTLNQMNARRELSAQQVVSALLGYKNHVTNARFSTVYWSQLLNWICPDEFHSPPATGEGDPTSINCLPGEASGDPTMLNRKEQAAGR